MEPMKIRHLAFDDLPDVLAIERSSFPNPWSLAMFMLELSKPQGVCLAAVTPDDELIGYLVCSRYATAWHLMNLAVHPSRRRRYIASRLLERLSEITTSESGITQHTLEVRLSNLAAIRMYERCGFQSAEVRRGYYQDDGEDALIMWRTSEASEWVEQQLDRELEPERY